MEGKRGMLRGQIENHGMFFDSEKLTMTPLAIDPDTWQFMGYNNDNEAA